MSPHTPKRFFEHQRLIQGQELKAEELKALRAFYGSGKDFPYYSLTSDGIKLCQYVGVIQVGKTVLEVLPKLDMGQDQEQINWQSILIGMLQAVHDLDIRSTGSSKLKLKSNSILELYFELFIREVEYLVRTGLVRKYRSFESNRTSLKGRLIFAKHIQKNLIHQERFFTRYTCYDHQHIWHIIIYKTILLIKKLCNTASLHSRIGQLELCFPPMPDQPITVNTFARLRYNRQTERYQKAIEIARLLLLNYHPDVQRGRNHVLALMFDMNELWERFVFISLRKHCKRGDAYLVRGQKVFGFWQAEKTSSKIIPDILIYSNPNTIAGVWDTKWKLVRESKPSSSDLQQMYAYAGILDTPRVALVYPGTANSVEGRFIHLQDKQKGAHCSLLFIPVQEDISKWQKSIHMSFIDWLVRIDNPHN